MFQLKIIIKTQKIKNIKHFPCLHILYFHI